MLEFWHQTSAFFARVTALEVGLNLSIGLFVFGEFIVTMTFNFIKARFGNSDGGKSKNG